MAKDLNNQLDDLFTGQEEPIRATNLALSPDHSPAAFGVAKELINHG
jgi:hypothetical protein